MPGGDPAGAGGERGSGCLLCRVSPCQHPTKWVLTVAPDLVPAPLPAAAELGRVGSLG